MKRALLALAALAALALPASALAERGGHHGGRDDGGNRQGEWRGGDRGGGNGWRGDDRGNRGDKGGRRGGEHWNQDGGRGRWDPHRNNGYWMGNRWTYGPPPEGDFNSPGFRPGYSAWRRGGYLPPYYRGGYAVPDYYRYRLRRPPLGYHWVRIGPDYLLISEHTGQIFDVILGGAY